MTGATQIDGTVKKENRNINRDVIHRTEGRRKKGEVYDRPFTDRQVVVLLERRKDKRVEVAGTQKSIIYSSK